MNKQHPILLFVILALLATAPFANAQAQQPSEEQLARILKRFPEADKDKDGKLNTEEFEAVRQQFRQSRQRNTRPAVVAEEVGIGDAKLTETLAGMNARFKNVEVQLLEWPSELHEKLGKMKKLAFVARPVEKIEGKLPLLISLHGGGPRWWNMSLQEQLAISAPGGKIEELRGFKKLRGFDLAELAGKGMILLEPNTAEIWNPGTLDTMLDYVLANYPEIDKDRVYVMGYSMGGRGTWAWINESADRFAAAAPCGFSAADTGDVKKLVKLPIWAMAGGDDGERTTGVRKMVERLRAAGNVNVKHTEFEGADHRAGNAAEAADHQAGDRPNFVIVLGDDVSWTSFGCVDGGLSTRTPNIDKLASEGLRFTNFMCSVAQCAPVRHELYTGLLPPSSGVYSNGSKPRGDYQNIANYLGELGYKVGLTGKTHFNVSDFHQISGFERNGNHSAPTWEMSGVKQFMETSQSENKPFCVVVASVNAHHPWTVGDPSNFPLDQIVVPSHMVDTPLTREALATHAAEVEVLDDQVGATMKLLDDLKLTDNTVLIFLSEQGTALPNGKWSVYDYGTRALCLMRWPGNIKPAVTDAVAMYCDISSTLVDIAGGEAPATDGQSLLPVLKGETSDHRGHAYLVHQAGGYTQRAIRNKEFKLVWNPEREVDYYLDVLMKPNSGKFFAKAWREWLEKAQTDPTAQAKIDRVVKHPEFELYNIKNDPWELNNLAGNPEHAQKVGEMHAQLKADMEKLKDAFSTVDPKDAKRAKKGEPDRPKGAEPMEKPEPSKLTDKQKKREARKKARQKSKDEESE